MKWANIKLQEEHTFRKTAFVPKVISPFLLKLPMHIRAVSKKAKEQELTPLSYQLISMANTSKNSQ
jgi:hypothetical protein